MLHTTPDIPRPGTPSGSPGLPVVVLADALLLDQLLQAKGQLEGQVVVPVPAQAQGHQVGGGRPHVAAPVPPGVVLRLVPGDGRNRVVRPPAVGVLDLPRQLRPLLRRGRPRGQGKEALGGRAPRSAGRCRGRGCRRSGSSGPTSCAAWPRPDGRSSSGSAGPGPPSRARCAISTRARSLISRNEVCSTPSTSPYHSPPSPPRVAGQLHVVEGQVEVERLEAGGLKEGVARHRLVGAVLDEPVPVDVALRRVPLVEGHQPGQRLLDQGSVVASGGRRTGRPSRGSGSASSPPGPGLAVVPQRPAPMKLGTMP